MTSCVPPELLQLRVCEKERLVEEQPLVNQDWKASLKQEEFERAQIKEEPEELPAGELRLKQEPSDPEWTSVKEEPHKSEDQSADWHPEESPEESRVNVPVIASVVSLSSCQLQEPAVNSEDCQSEAPKGVKQEDSARKDVKRRRRKKQVSKNGAANKAYRSLFCGRGELKKQKQKRSRLWVHPILMLREEMGEFHTTVQELKCYPVRFRQHFRMTVGQFEGLLLQLAPRLQKEKTNYREPIDPEQRLVTCLR